MPVRKIPRSHTSITGRYSLGPGKGSVGFESTLERDFVRLMAFDPDVTSIEEQPVRIDYADDTGRPHHYTPDYLVHRHNAPPLLAEVKPTKFLKPDLQPKFDAAQVYASKRDWVFEVWTEKDIRTQKLTHIRLLEPYRRRQEDPGRMARILRQVDDSGPIRARDLLTACWTDKEELEQGEIALWHLIAIGKLLTDMEHPLTDDSILFGQGRPS